MIEKHTHVPEIWPFCSKAVRPYIPLRNPLDRMVLLLPNPDPNLVVLVPVQEQLHVARNENLKYPFK